MRGVPLLVLSTLWLAACEPSGMRVHLQLPAGLDVAQVQTVTVEVQADSSTHLGGASLSSDETLTADGRLLIDLDKSRYPISSAFDVVLAPTSMRPTTTSVGACASSAAGALLAVAQPIQLVFSSTTTATQPGTLAFACERTGCAPIVSPPYQEIEGLNGDNLALLGVSHFTSTDDTYTVLGAPTRMHAQQPTGAVFLVSRALHACPQSIAIADRIIYGRAGDALGAAAAVGDFDGDGLEDLAVSGVAADGTGVVYMIPNPVLIGSRVLDFSNDNALTSVLRITGSGADGLGTQLAAAAVTKNPAADSLIVLAPNATGQAGDGSGVAYVLYGTPANLAARTLTAAVPLAADGVAVRAAGSTALANLAAGDLDGDGTPDLAVGVSSSLGGQVAIVSGKLLGSGGERSLASDAVIVTGTGDRLFGTALKPGLIVRPGDAQRWRLTVGSPNEGKVFLLALPSTLWDATGVPVAPNVIGHKDARLGELAILGRGGFGNALALAPLAGDSVNTLVVGNEKVGDVAVLRPPPLGATWDLRTSDQLAAASVVVLARTDTSHWGSSLRTGYSLADLIIGGDLLSASRGVVAVYAVPSS
jgi:hypothetical protein